MGPPKAHAFFDRVYRIDRINSSERKSTLYAYPVNPVNPVKTYFFEALCLSGSNVFGFAAYSLIHAWHKS
jgi:hypothetical protein